MEVRRDQWRKRPRRGDAAVCLTLNPRASVCSSCDAALDLGTRPPNLYLVFAFSGRGDAEAETDPANPTLASLCPPNSSGRVSLDRYQDLEIDLRECSITRQKRVAGPRDGPVKPLSCITSGLMRGGER